MAKKGGETKITKQFILEHCDENEVDLSLCDLSKVPVKELAMVPRGTKLDLSSNHLDSIPDSFGTLKHLVELDLSNNSLKELPATFSQLVNLQRLDLYNNKLVSLPLTFWELKKLKWLDLKNNQLEPELAAAAGTCVSAQECKECAKKVLVFAKKKSSEAERLKQKQLEEERELERQRLEEKRRLNELARREKAEVRQRRKEQARLEAEKREQKQREEILEEEVEVSSTATVVENATQQKSKKCTCGCVCKLLTLLVFFVTLLAIAMIFLCDRFYGDKECKQLENELSTQIDFIVNFVKSKLG